MLSRFQSRGWRRCRRVIRWLRITFLLLLLFIVAAGGYLNKVGLPGFLRTRLVERLHERGVDIQFTRLRLRYYRGIVAEDVRFGRANESTNGPNLSAREVELKINHSALRHFTFSIDSLILHGGRFVWPLAETNGQPRALSVEDIQTRVQFLTNDEIQLDHFGAAFAGANMRVSGTVTNASAISDWPIFQPGPHPSQPARVQERLTELADIIDSLKFSQPPLLNLALHGDGRDPRSFHGILKVSAAGAQTPWGALTDGYLAVRLMAPNATNSLHRAEFNLHADRADTPWGSTRRFQLEAQGVADAADTNLVHCHLDLQADQFTTQWAEATNAQFTATWSHSMTNAMPLAGQVGLQLSATRTKWAEAQELRVVASLEPPPTNGAPQADARWGQWADLAPYPLDWNCRLTDVRAREFQVKEIDCAGLWRAPDVTITNLHSELYQGQFTIQAALNVATRVVTFKGFENFDAHSFDSVLTPLTRKWLGQFTWEKPPLVRGEGGITLPAWTNRQPDWEGEVHPTLWFKGEVQADHAAYCTVPVISCTTHVLYTNLTCDLPDLVAVRREGDLRLRHFANDRTRDYYFSIHSDIDPQAIRPLPFISTNEVKVLDMLTFTRNPVVDLQLWGRWHDKDRTGIKAHVSMTNFTFRGEPGDHLHTDIQFTNHFVQFDYARLEREGRFAKADHLLVNFDRQTLFITNGFSTVDPMVIIRPIGPKIVRTMEPYHFVQPPSVRVNGIIPLRDDVPANVRFDVDGGPFQWKRFNVTHISGGVNWVGDHLTLSRIESKFYQGRMTGSAEFAFNHGTGTDFNFDTVVTGTDLGAVMKDLFSPSNHLEGTLNGHLAVTRANTDDIKSWFGRGQADLRDGLIWEIPIFGGVSKLLDAVSPGLGESRASEGAATFTITNSVIRSTDLEIRSPTLRLDYKGTCDFDGQVNADVDAKVGGNIPLFGKVITTVLLPFEKAFECKVTGTLGQPKIELKWLAMKLISMPFQFIFHPFSTLESIAPPAQPAATNAPPAFGPVPPPSTNSPPAAAPPATKAP
ncbi:MAG TPA: AsmA-like C-terminal region-containing protein [Verrucomicrobiae bacterium]|nr:AsmA-like C-terminal region-containing protein [Verrucomicrobiae bacterium]